MPMLLERIEIEGFKSIREMALDLRPINVLIGANGSGKSNFISVFTLLQRLTEGRLRQYVATMGGANALLHHGRKRTSSLRLMLTMPSRERRPYLLEFEPSADDSLVVADEAALPQEQGSDSLRVDIEVAFDRLIAFGGLRVYHFHDTSVSASVKQTQDIGDNAALRSDAANLAAFLFLLREKHPESYRRIVATVRLAAPYFDDFRLRPSPFNDQKILLEWSERDSDDYFNAHALSDGTLRFICLATLLLQPKLPPMIIIDEPELGLHPYAIQLLAGMVRSASQKSQIILSTQSVTLVNQFTPEDLVIVDRQDRASTFHRPTSEETASWLESYSLGELWEKNVLGGRPG
ncbi:MULTISPECIES: AAA family ATPase [Corallococcus]|uniref:AAA family ATPase n=1 Tax=Corallococcus TaxID=83461 RepID=UPI0018F43F8A|nr:MULTISPECIES: AAA family ATPase [Corallococcus]